MAKNRLGLIVGLTGGLVLVGVSLREGWVSDRNEPAGLVEGSGVPRKTGTATEIRERSLPPSHAEVGVRRQDGPSSEKGQYLVLGKRQQIELELDKLRLERVFDDGATQYTYEDGTVVTILPDGEVLLLPEEI